MKNQETQIGVGRKMRSLTKLMAMSGKAGLFRRWFDANNSLHQTREGAMPPPAGTLMADFTPGPPSTRLPRAKAGF